MTALKAKRAQRGAEIIGWREKVALPELGVADMRAKIDTGARTSAMHAEDIEVFEHAGRKWVRFRVPGTRTHKDMRVETPVHDEREIKNTSGVPESRLIIETALVLGRHHWHVEVSLANRENMGFDMILGRTAIRGRNVLVNPGKSFVAGEPKVKAPNSTCSDAARGIGTKPEETGKRLSKGESL
ncbi:ATP-dependent zinc protease [Roseibium sp.]|uniref:ATP-dependent zinc protease family protein n=1 Tax=Roseibium sp. TaxID=1936156 RepID=UPI003A987191